MARLIADEDVPRSAVEGLRALGHDVLTTHEAGRAGRGIPDGQVLAHAHSLGRAVLTKNRRDFIHLHRDDPVHSGIVAFSEDLDYLALAARIDEALRLQGDLDVALIRVNRPSH